MQKMSPGELDHPAAHTSIASFGKPSLASLVAALVWCTCQTRVPRDGPAITQLAREHLLHQHVGAFNADADYPCQQVDHGMASFSRLAFQSLDACRLDLLDLLLDEAQTIHVAPQLGQRVCRYRSTLRCLQYLQLPGRLSQVRPEAANAEPGEISFHSVYEAGDLLHKVLALTARSPRVLVCDCGHRSHAAVLWFTAQPAEKSALKELGVESIGLRPSMFARYRNARRMDHIGFDLMGAQPARQPEAIAASLIGDGDPLDDVAGLIGFLPPTMQKLQQCILIGRELFQRLSFNSRHNTGDQPT